MTAYWDVQVFADETEVRDNRIDGRIVNKARKTVTLLEMSCPWVDNRDHKDGEKTMKYTPLRLELKRQYPGFNICLLYTSPSPRDLSTSRMPSSA